MVNQNKRKSKTGDKCIAPLVNNCETYEEIMKKKAKVVKDTSFCSLLVHDTVTTFSASDGVSGANFIFVVTFWQENIKELVNAKA